MEGHTNKSYDRDLSDLKQNLLLLGNLVERSIISAIKALEEMDGKLAASVIADDDQIDRKEVEIDEFCHKVIALRQPAAKDLRFITTALKINYDLERIGDLSSNIAKEALDSIGKPLLKPLVDIPRMGDLDITMIKMAFRAISEKNAELARECIAMDRQVDEINMQIYRELFSYMAENPATLSPSLGLIMVAKALERIGDHATNIAERAVYYIEGEDIRHQE